jgi:N-acetylmuramoyl-L-alanine amidase
VRPGDTLAVVARNQHTTIRVLARANRIANVNLIRVGQYLTIPDSARPSYYRVRWGDTLLGVAARFGMTLRQIRALNPSLGQYLLAESWLQVCSACGSDSSQTQSAPSTVHYLVQAGDTLSGIALRYGVTRAAIEAANGIANPSLIVAGSYLDVPNASSGASAQSSGDVPASEAESLIVSWSRNYGIAPSLALAVAYQESGFNQSVTSSTGAIGVMQVEPYTGVIISRLLGRPVNLYNVQDNVQGGVFWLTHLLVFYGWDAALAVAAYYEGTKSLTRYGVFADTQQYVNNVLALQSRFGG